MEVVDMFGSIDIIRTNPTILLVGVFVTEPLDEITESLPESAVKFRVNDLFNFEMLITVDDFYRGRRWFLTVRKGVRNVRFKLGYVKDG